MKPPVFEYLAACSVDEAVEALAQRGSEAKILAGGQSLIPMMKLRLARPSALIDINPIRELDYLRLSNEHLAVGATARTYELESKLVREQCPLAVAAVDFIGYPPIRHRGTVCGSLAHADPAAELPVVALCLDAELLVQGPRGKRTIRAADFFVSYFSTALASDEILVETCLPVMPPSAGWAFVELCKRAGDFAVVAVAAVLERGPAGIIHRARLALGAVADRPVRCVDAERAITGQPATAETFRAAAATVAERLDPPSDIHASGAYRRKVAQVLVERALTQAWGRAR